MIENNFNKELERKIDLYVNGKLNEEQTDELWAELIQNGYYLDYMKTVVNLKGLIDRKRSEKPAAKVFAFKTYAKYVSAAAVLIIAGVLGVLNYNGGEQLAVQPVSDIGLDVVRSADGISEETKNEVIKNAIRLATSGNVSEAIEMLDNELKSAEEPQVVAELALSLGSIRYNYGNYEAAIENFKLITRQEGIDKLTLEKGYWFLGNTYFQLDMLAEAEGAFQNAYDLDGAYSRISRTYVEALQKAD